jgi:hypothetical protein
VKYFVFALRAVYLLFVVYVCRYILLKRILSETYSVFLFIENMQTRSQVDKKFKVANIYDKQNNLIPSLILQLIVLS